MSYVFAFIVVMNVIAILKYSKQKGGGRMKEVLEFYNNMREVSLATSIDLKDYIAVMEEENIEKNQYERLIMSVPLRTVRHKSEDEMYWEKKRFAAYFQLRKFNSTCVEDEGMSYKTLKERVSGEPELYNELIELLESPAWFFWLFKEEVEIPNEFLEIAEFESSLIENVLTMEETLNQILEPIVSKEALMRKAKEKEIHKYKMQNNRKQLKKVHPAFGRQKGGV